MSLKFPIVSVTGSSGAGTTSVRRTFEIIFRREKIKAAFIEGDAFHRYDRAGMKEQAAKGNDHVTHFAPDMNLLERLAATFEAFGERGEGETRHYVHDEDEAEAYGSPPGTFTDWEPLPKDVDLLFYEGLHGAAQTGDIDVGKHADLRIGVVPVINLEWIQKIHRDRMTRGYSTEAITETILKRMPDYVNYICPQFTKTDINFQRVPVVDTSNPFVARWIPTADESMVVIRFADPHGIDFAYLLGMIPQSFMSRANSIVISGSKLDLAMQLILTPMIMQLVDRRRRAAA